MKQLVLFFIIACVLSWSAMFLWNVPKNANDPKDIINAFERVSFFYAFGPFLSAVGVTIFFRRLAGIKSLFKPVVKWRVGWVCYFWALAAPVLVQLLSLCLWNLWNGNGLKIPSFVDAVKMWLIATPIISIFIITEETGWRGFALQRFQSFSSALSASLILGLLWSLWHYPLEIAVECAYGEPTARIILSLFVFTTVTMLFAVLMTWIFNSSGGSLLLMMLMHGSCNSSLFNVLTALDSGGRYILSFRICYMIALLFAVSLLLLIYGAANLSKADKVTFADIVEQPLS
jgi:uncharacterized protein